MLLPQQEASFPMSWLDQFVDVFVEIGREIHGFKVDSSVYIQGTGRNSKRKNPRNPRNADSPMQLGRKEIPRNQEMLIFRVVWIQELESGKKKP